MKNRVFRFALAALMIILLLPLSAFTDVSYVSFRIANSNGCSGTVSYKFSTESSFTVVSDGSSVMIPSEAVSVTVKAIPDGDGKINQRNSGIVAGGNRIEGMDFDALNSEAGYTYTFTDDAPQFEIEFDNHDGTGGGAPQDPEHKDGHIVKIQINNNDGANGTVLCKFDTDNDFRAFTKADYDNTGNIRLDIPQDAKTVTFKTEPDEGFALQDCTILYDDQDIDESKAYRSGVEGDGYEYSIPDDDNMLVFRADFGYAFLSWHTVSWGGGNVTVKNGKVIPDAIHVGEATYMAPFTELTAPDALMEKHVTYSEGDLFIADGTTDEVSIDFRFIPDYGYQVTDVRATEDSLLDQFAPGEEISTFSFVYKGGNVHFIVEFSSADDIINSEGSIVESAAINNGQNAIDSGNLRMDIADVSPEEVSSGLLEKVGENDAQYLEMELYQVVSKGGENGDWENKLTELDGSIDISLTVPELDPDGEYYIIREHTNEDGSLSYDEIPVEYDPDTASVSFAADKFSTYALVSSAVEPDEPAAPTSYTVSFDMNGHGEQVQAQTVEEGGKAVKPAEPKAKGYSFNGWYADASFSAKFDFDSPITADTTVYAKWTKNSVAPTDPSNPKTGDNSHMILWITFAIISAGALFGTAVYGKVRKYNGNK